MLAPFFLVPSHHLYHVLSVVSLTNSQAVQGFPDSPGLVKTGGKAFIRGDPSLHPLGSLTAYVVSMFKPFAGTGSAGLQYVYGVQETAPGTKSFMDNRVRME
ncbi:hypothetical protein AOLI_G00133680 [Acnodon oligacanthus]